MVFFAMDQFSTLIEIIVVILFTIIVSWSIYHTPIMILGLMAFKRRKAFHDCAMDDAYEPSVSIIIPVKNGAKTLDRLMASLLAVDYPKEKMEIIFVEDGSTDGSYEICKSYEEKFPGLVKVLHRDQSRGKPDALSYATGRASGEILVVFDVDSVIDSKAFKLALRWFRDERVAAVQGRTISMNFRSNLLTWLVYLEELWFSLILMGRQRLGLFTPLTGNCMFIRKSYLEKVGGWDCNSLTEDVELSVRLIKHGYVIIYEKEVKCLQEAPSRLKHLMSQRNRWYRGYLETLMKSFRLLRGFDLKFFDSVILLSSPIMAILGQILYPLVIVASMLVPHSPLVNLILRSSLILLISSLLAVMSVVILLFKPGRMRLLTCSLAIYLYWWLLSLIALKSCLDMIMRAPKRWITTPKEGGAWPISPPIG